MKKSFRAPLFLSVLLLIFSGQNTKPVELDLFFKEVSISLAILLIAVFLTDAIACASTFLLHRK